MKLLDFFPISIVVLILFSCSSDEPTQTDNDNPVIPNAKPNILLIIADDMGQDATPGFEVGSSKPQMPNLQNMINTGVRFTNLWSYPTCTPTRSSIMTGKYGFRTGVMKVDDVLPTTEISLQQYLKNKNSAYSTAVIGKWHLSKDTSHPTQMGVDYYAGLLTGSAQSYTDWNFTENGTTTSSSEYATTKFTDLAIDWVQKQESPWFLWLAYNAPHTPFHLPPVNMHSQGSLPADQAAVDANPLPYYLAMIEAMDYEIGRLLNSLTAEQRDNTLIIFIGDNGSPAKVAQEYPRRRAKGTLYQGGVNVPMIVSGNNVSRSNQSDDSLLNTTDLFATIIDATGNEVNTINDSYSFSDLFINTTNANSRNYIYTEHGKGSGNDEYAIRNTTHKYIMFTDGTEAFYNLNADFFEIENLLESNLSDSDQQELDKLKEILNNLKQ